MSDPRLDPDVARPHGGPCGRRTKALLLAVLVAAFGVQTWLVYSDAPGIRQLDALEVAGRRSWHEHNCQSCHQLYGFGGFLGPDLTNSAERITVERLQAVLEHGAGAMPRTPTALPDRDALFAFLGAMAHTGRGQARAPRLSEPGPGVTPEGFVAAARALLRDQADTDAENGLALLARGNCLVCHPPFQPSPMGATELTRALERRRERDVLELLAAGSPRGMPAFPMDAEEQRQLIRVLAWLGAKRADLSSRLGAGAPGARFDWAEVPWWEFP